MLCVIHERYPQKQITYTEGHDARIKKIIGA